jgi:hypothetical protein
MRPAKRSPGEDLANDLFLEQMGFLFHFSPLRSVRVRSVEQDPLRDATAERTPDADLSSGRLFLEQVPLFLRFSPLRNVRVRSVEQDPLWDATVERAPDAVSSAERLFLEQVPLFLHFSPIRKRARAER